MAAKDTDEQKPEADDSEHTLDMSQAAVKRMIADARERGYITYDQLNSALPPEQVSSEQIEDVMSMLSEMGINVIEEEEAEEGESAAGAVVEASTSREVAIATSGPTTRCGCTCARWGRWSFCRARAKSPSRSASRPAATR